MPAEAGLGFPHVSRKTGWTAKILDRLIRTKSHYTRPVWVVKPHKPSPATAAPSPEAGCSRIRRVIESGDSLSQGIESRLSAVGQVQLAQYVAHVRPNRPFADHEAIGNLLIG